MFRIHKPNSKAVRRVQILEFQTFVQVYIRYLVDK
jgi:hypothetical protein